MEPIKKEPVSFIDHFKKGRELDTRRQKLITANINQLADRIISGKEKLSFNKYGVIRVHSSKKRMTRPLTKYVTGNEHYSYDNLQEFVDYVVAHYKEIPPLIPGTVEAANSNLLKLYEFYKNKNDLDTAQKILNCHDKLEKCLTSEKTMESPKVIISPLEEEDYKIQFDEHFTKPLDHEKQKNRLRHLLISAVHYDLSEDFRALLQSDDASEAFKWQLEDKKGQYKLTFFELLTRECSKRVNPISYYRLLMEFVPVNIEKQSLYWAIKQGNDQLLDVFIESGKMNGSIDAMSYCISRTNNLKALEKILRAISWDDAMANHQKKVDELAKWKPPHLERYRMAGQVVLDFLEASYPLIKIKNPDFADFIDRTIFHGERGEEMAVKFLALRFGLSGSFRLGEKEIESEGYNGNIALNELSRSFEKFAKTGSCSLSSERVEKIVTALKEGGRWATGKEIWLKHQNHINLPSLIPTEMENHFMTLVLWNNLVAKCNKDRNEEGLVGFQIFKMTKPENFDEAFINRLLGYKHAENLTDMRRKKSGEFIGFKDFAWQMDCTLGLKHQYEKGTKSQKVGNCPWASSKLALRALLFFAFLEEDQQQWRRLVIKSNWDALMEKSEAVFQAWRAFDLKMAAEEAMKLEHNPFTLPMSEEDKTLGDVIVEKCHSKAEVEPYHEILEAFLKE